MKVYEINEGYGIDSLALVERTQPQPAYGQILVKVRAVSLNYRDLLVVKGFGSWKAPLPRIPVTDGSGDVIAVGEGVSRVRVGDRVASIFVPRWLDGELTPEKLHSPVGGTEADGMLAEYAVLNADGVVHLPPHLSYEEAATLPCAAVTAWHALIRCGRLKPGDDVLIQGTGGVSIFALQFARLAGARVIITSSSDQKLERARRLGAGDGINYREQPDWEASVLELTAGRGVDHIVEVGGAGSLNKSLEAVRMGGTISMIGILTGLDAVVSTVTIMQKNVRVQGLATGSREMFEEMNRAISHHQLRPVIDRVFPFAEAREALKYLESGTHFGKICINIC